MQKLDTTLIFNFSMLCHQNISNSFVINHPTSTFRLSFFNSMNFIDNEIRVNQTLILKNKLPSNF